MNIMDQGCSDNPCHIFWIRSSHRADTRVWAGHCVVRQWMIRECQGQADADLELDKSILLSGSIISGAVVTEFRFYCCICINNVAERN